MNPTFTRAMLLIWHFLDLTPEGRDDWYPELTYERHAAATT
jgi:hypothetical protein